MGILITTNFVDDDILHENIYILFHPRRGAQEENVSGVNLKKISLIN